MTYREKLLAIGTVDLCGLVDLDRAEQVVIEADAEIAGLRADAERIDAQWREELRIYRESEGVRIAGLEAEIAGLRAALLSERERICAAIKETDDAASAHDYMLDSDDCIAVVRGELGPSNYPDAPARANGGEG